MQVQVAGSHFRGDWLVTIGLFFIFELRRPAPTVVLLLQHLL